MYELGNYFSKVMYDSLTDKYTYLLVLILSCPPFQYIIKYPKPVFVALNRPLNAVILIVDEFAIFVPDLKAFRRYENRVL